MRPKHAAIDLSGLKAPALARVPDRIATADWPDPLPQVRAPEAMPRPVPSTCTGQQPHRPGARYGEQSGPYAAIPEATQRRRLWTKTQPRELGDYRIPWGGPAVRLLRFWGGGNSLLRFCGIWSPPRATSMSASLCLVGGLALYWSSRAYLDSGESRAVDAVCESLVPYLSDGGVRIGAAWLAHRPPEVTGERGRLGA
jgi:hypothetical protein